MQHNRANWISLVALLVLVVAIPWYGLAETQRMERAKIELRESYVMNGIDLYVQNCASCHGANGLGIGMMPALNRPGMTEVDDEDLIRIIARESHGSLMAAWHINNGGNLTDYQVNNVATLVKHADWDEVSRIAAVSGYVEPQEPAVENGLTYLQTENGDDPHQCIACHEEPAVHSVVFGINCARCHNTLSWTPAVLTRHDFLLDHGDMGEVDCKTCHPADYTTYDCYGCHEDHQPAEMETAHVKELIFEYADCARCHPTGVEGEADRLRKENPNLNGTLPLDPGQISATPVEQGTINIDLVQALTDENIR
jgi:mono/diheme cytochrome c family protein